MSLQLLSITGLMIMVVALLLFRESLFCDSVISIAVQILALFLMVWARVTFGRRSFHAAANPMKGGLVTSGPYRFLRHPIYAAALYFTLAGVLSHLSTVNVLVGILAIVGAGLRMYTEEKLLLARYPEYQEYAIHTKRIIPYLI